MSRPAVSISSMQTAEEARSFERLNTAWISELFEMEDVDRAALGNPFGAIVEPGGDVLVARRQERVVGCVALISAGDGAFELSKMAVDPEERGRGIGRELVLAAVARAEELGAAKLYLISNRQLAVAVRLYESLGFRHVAPEELGPAHYERADVFMTFDL